MTLMKKTIAILLVFMLCLCSAFSVMAEETDPETADESEQYLPDSCTQSLYGDDEDTWSLEMLWYNSGVIFMSIEHRTAENEADIWSINIENAFETDTFEYIDAYKAHAVLDTDDGTLGNVQTVYENGTGTVTLDGDFITWTDNADGVEHIFGLISATTTTNYTDSEKGAEMSATTAEEDNSVLSCVIEWSISGTEKRIWNMTLTWNDEANQYTYKDAVCTRQMITDTEFTQETLYSNGSGLFQLMDDGSLVWEDRTDNTGTGLTFVMNMISL